MATQQQLAFAIRAVNEASKTLREVQADVEGVGESTTKTASRSEAAGTLIRNNWKEAAAAGAALATGTEMLARSQKDSSDAVARLASQTGLSREEIRGMVTDVAHAGDNLAEMTRLMEIGTKQGARGAESLKNYADFWDTVADATGLAGEMLAEKGAALQAVGIDVDNLRTSEAAFSFVQTQTTAGVEGFLDLLQRKAPEIRRMGLSVDETAAFLGILEGRGLSGRAALTAFDEAVTQSKGSMTELFAILGITSEQFEEYIARVQGASGEIAKLAEANNSNFTVLQRLKHAVDEQLFSQSELVGVTASYATIVGGLGTALPVVARGFQQAQAAAAAMNITVSASGIGIALLAASLVAGAVMWQAHTRAVERDRIEQERHQQVTSLIAEGTTDEVRSFIAGSRQKIESLERERESLDAGARAAQGARWATREVMVAKEKLTSQIDLEKKSLNEAEAALNKVTDASRGLSIETRELTRQLSSVTAETLAAAYANSIYAAEQAGATEATNELFQAAVEDVRAKQRQSSELKSIADSILKASDITRRYEDSTNSAAGASREFADAQKIAEQATRAQTQALEEQERRSMSLARAAASLGDQIRRQQSDDISRLIGAGIDPAAAIAVAQANAAASFATRQGQIIQAANAGTITFAEAERANRALQTGSPDPFLETLKLAGLAEGGIVRARPGGTLAVIGEGGQDEAVIPLPRSGVAPSLGMAQQVSIYVLDQDALVRALALLERRGRLAAGTMVA